MTGSMKSIARDLVKYLALMGVQIRWDNQQMIIHF